MADSLRPVLARAVAIFALRDERFDRESANNIPELIGGTLPTASVHTTGERRIIEDETLMPRAEWASSG